MNEVVIRHGVASSYGHRGCRCRECTAAQSAHVRAWRATSNGKSRSAWAKRRRTRRHALVVGWVQANYPAVWTAIGKQVDKEFGC